MNGKEIKHILKEIICSLKDCQSVTVNYTISNIGPQLKYIFIADILDYLNNTKAKNESLFTTYHVQGLTLQYYSDNGSVVIECRFAERSTADGCHVIFRESSKGTVNSTNITKSSIEESTVYQYTSLPVSGNYTVTAHDIVNGTIITNPSVVYPQVLEYILLPSPSETIFPTKTSSDKIFTDLSSVNKTSTSEAPWSLYFLILLVGVVLLAIMIIFVFILTYCIWMKKRSLKAMIEEESMENHLSLEELTYVTTSDSIHVNYLKSQRKALKASKNCHSDMVIRSNADPNTCDQDITIAPYIVPEHFGTTVTVSKTRPSVACNATEHTLHNTLLSDKQCSLPHTKDTLKITNSLKEAILISEIFSVKHTSGTSIEDGSALQIISEDNPELVLHGQLVPTKTFRQSLENEDVSVAFEVFHTPDDKFIGVTISKPIAVQDNDCTFIKISIHLQIPQGMKVLSNRCLVKTSSDSGCDIPKSFYGYKRALVNEEMDVAYGCIMLLGSAGVGKTSLKRSLMKFPWQSYATSSTISGVRYIQPFGNEWYAMSLEHNDDKYREVTVIDKVEEMAQLFAIIYKDHSSPRSVINMVAASEFQEIETTKVNEILSKAIACSNNVSPCDFTSIKSQSILHIWDCGGQPVFLEILPAFLTPHTLFLLMFDASQYFNEKSQRVQNTEERQIFGEEVNVTTFELMLNWVASIHGHLIRREKEVTIRLYEYPRIYCIGTHGDILKTDEKKKAVVEDLESNYKDKPFMELVNETLIIDNTRFDKGKDEDPNLIKLRKSIFQFTNENLIVKTPVSWILFHKVIQLFDKNVIDLEEAYTIGETCKIPHDDVPKVLLFFHDLGVVLFYPQIIGLKNKVIINPKWFVETLGKVFILDGQADEHTRLMWKLQQEKGILVQPLYVSLWRDCTADLSPEALIELLVHFRLAVKVNTREYFDQTIKQYFLPAALKTFKGDPNEVLPGYYLQATPLHITFSRKCVPPGFFTRFITSFASSPSCKLVFKYGTYCNRVTFAYDKSNDHITLTDLHYAIQIDVLRYAPSNLEIPSFDTICQELLCSLKSCGDLVEQTLTGQWKKFTSTQSVSMEREFQYVCKCDQSEVHYFNISVDSSSIYCEKSMYKSYRRPTAEERVWFKGWNIPEEAMSLELSSPPVTKVSSVTGQICQQVSLENEIVNKPTKHDILVQMVSVDSSWRDIGTYLRVSTKVFDSLAPSHMFDQARLKNKGFAKKIYQQEVLKQHKATIWQTQFGKVILGKLPLLPPRQLETHNRYATCKTMTQKLYTRKKIEVIPQVTQEKKLDIQDVLKLDMDVTLLLDKIEDQQTALLPVSEGHHDIIRLKLNSDSDPNICDLMDQKAVLHLASKRGYCDIVQILLNFNADLNICDVQSWDQLLDQQPPLIELIPHAKTSKWFKLGVHLELNDVDLNECDSDLSRVYNLGIQEKAENTTRRNLLSALRAINESNVAKIYEDYLKTLDHQAALHLASRKGHCNIVQPLLNSNTDPNTCDKWGQTPLHVTYWYGHDNIVEHLCSFGGRGIDQVRIDDLLLTAAENCTIENVTQAIISCADVNIQHPKKWGQTPLHNICWNDKPNIVKVLCSFGARDIDQIRIDDLLLTAAENGDIENVTQALTSGANVNVHHVHHSKYQQTALHLAVRKGCCDIMQLLLNSNADPNICDKNGQTPAHYAAKQGHVDNLKLLFEIGQADINATDKRGDSLLHLACANSNVDVISYLLYTGKVNPLISNNHQNTPLEEVLLHDPNRFEILKMFEPFEKCHQNYTVDSYRRVFFCGNMTAGKSSLAQCIINHFDKPADYDYNPFQCIEGVQVETAGINYHNIRSHEIGNIVLYDFAGHQEYYSSHAAVLESVMLRTPAVFTIVIDSTKDFDYFKKQLYYWFNFIENVCANLTKPSQVIVVGSYADQFTNSYDEFKSHVDCVVKDAIHKQEYRGFVAMECHRPGGKGFPEFIVHIRESCMAVLDKSDNISYYCHVHYAYLQKLQKVAFSLKELIKGLKGVDDLSLPSDETVWLHYLSILSDKGLVLFLRNKIVSNSWIVVNKSSLLAEVNGVLFNQTIKGLPIPTSSNTGIVHVSVLRELFPLYDTNMLIDFLISMEFCHVIDSDTLDTITTNLSSSDKFSDLEALFFPALVTIEPPSDLNEHFKSGFGWCLYCTNPFQFLSTRFRHVLLLRLAYLFSLPCHRKVDKLDKKSPMQQLNRRHCTVWKNGIYWKHINDVEVEVTDDNRCVTVFVSNVNKVESQKVCCSVIKLVLSLQKQFCPCKVEEYIIPSGSLADIRNKAISERILYRVNDVAQGMLVNEEIFDHNEVQESPINVKHICPHEPYISLVPAVIHALFSDSKANQVIPEKLLQHIQEFAPSIMSSYNKSKGNTYSDVASHLNDYSFFTGQNPLDLLTQSLTYDMIVTISKGHLLSRNISSLKAKTKGSGDNYDDDLFQLLTTIEDLTQTDKNIIKHQSSAVALEDESVDKTIIDSNNTITGVDKSISESITKDSHRVNECVKESNDSNLSEGYKLSIEH